MTEEGMTILAMYNVKTPSDTTMWIPLMVRMAKLHSTNIYYVILILEIINLLLTFVSIFCVLFFAWKFKLVHINLMIISISQYIVYLLAAIARFVQIAYETQLIPVEGLYVFPIPWLAVMRCTVFANFLFFFFTIVIERSCATYFVKDYEEHTRIYIGLILNSISILSAVAISLAIVFAVISALVLAGIVFVLNLVAVALFFLLLTWNRRRLREVARVRSNSTDYTLTLRTQLNENIRTMHRLRIGGAMLFGAILLGVPAFVLATFIRFSDENMFQIATALMNLGCAAIVFIASIVFSISFEKIRKSILPEWLSERIFGRDLIRDMTTGAAKNEMLDAYFNDLDKFWDSTARNTRQNVIELAVVKRKIEDN